MSRLAKLFRLSWYMFLSSMRNPSTVFFGFAFPLIFITIFGGLSFGSGKRDVVIEPTSVQSGAVYEVLKSLDTVNLVTNRSSEDIQKGLERGSIAAAVNIQQDTTNQAQYAIRIRTSAAEPLGAAAVTQIITGVQDAINRQANPISTVVVRTESEEVRGREYKQIDFILPGQIGFALLGTAVFGVAFTLIGLRETLVLKRMYATPTPRWLLLGSQALARVYQGMITAVVVILVGVFAFGYTLVNGVWTFLAMLALSVLGLIVFLGFGLLAAAFAKSESGADPLTNIITLPQFILSGAFFTTEAFPEWLQRISQLLPLTYLNDAMRKVAFEGVGVQEILPQIGGLIVWGIIVYAIAIRFFRWEK